ncbi:hypothetical protein M7I_1805 [Glarea lozoyensis 74030]|uniref:Uncharacterized protein n=1 Tax=Glarea lozoyensis (strain ATCC 74030 / MF5533) TaxID=1104152 RepID=H0EGU7_GLAL7|nr:hypothetical protein M7I_1805 [Glarea lozoyensis 74030]
MFMQCEVCTTLPIEIVKLKLHAHSAGGERNKWRLSFDLWSGAIAFPSITNGVISSRKHGDRQPLDLVEFASKLTALSTSIVGVAQLWASQSRVVYSLTAQRDNELNLRIARLSKYQNDVSLKLSQFAVYEGRLNTRMAKQSLQYGTDMQVIAGVTLVFLPGTFVVTLFSASFWDFQPGNTGRIVSGWGRTIE